MPVPNTGIEDVFTGVPDIPSQPVPHIMPVAVPSAAHPASSNDLRALQLKYTEAQEEIAHLRALLASAPEPASELRRRNVASSVGEDTLTDDAGEAEKDMANLKLQQHEEYFSPQVVAIIALLVFTLTYLFF
jgi:hypothetical protein